MQVTVGLPESEDHDILALRRWGREQGGIGIRGFTWRKVNTASVRLMLKPALLPPGEEPVLLPDDAGREFRDAEAWIVLASHTHGRIPWLRPTAIFCGDLAPRRVGGGPGSAGDRLQLAEAMIGWRRAACAFATDPTTRDDLVTYAGIEPDRALLAPPVLAPPQPPSGIGLPSFGSDPGIVWMTSLGPEENHASAIAALRLYVARGGALDVSVCGPGTLALAEGGHPVARALAEAPELRGRLFFAGNRPVDGVQRLMTARGIVWHNLRAEIAPFPPFDAARADAHFVACDSPSLRWLSERHGIAPLTHAPWDPDAAANALLEAERRLRARASPGHAVREAAEEELAASYGEILRRLAAYG